VANLSSRRKEVDDTLYETLRAVYHYERALENALGLEYREIVLLQLARRLGPSRMGELSRLMELPLFAVTRLAKRLEERGFIVRTRDDNDGRGVNLSLTDDGERAVRAVEDYNFERMLDSTADLGDRETEALFSFARSLQRILGTPPEETP
jgi:DNA-binding MarR family transcriptional regulator